MSKFKWSESRRRYVYASNGRLVPETRIRAGLQSAIDASKATIDGFTQDLIAGRINAAEWSLRMREEIRNGHRAAALLANGGKLNPSALGKLGATVRAQYEYLSRFSAAIQNGEVALDKRLSARAQMYAQAVLPSYENQVRARERRAGTRQERRVLSPVESCVDCIEYARRGWQLIGTLPQIGDSICRVNCHCRFEYRGAGLLPQADPEQQPTTPARDGTQPTQSPATPADTGADARARMVQIAAEFEPERQARALKRRELANQFVVAKGKERKRLEREIIALDRTEFEMEERILTRYRQALEQETSATFTVVKARGLGRRERRAIDEGVEQFGRFVGAGKVDGRTITFYQAVDRSHYDTRGGIHLVGGVETVIHELGHWLEESSPGILQKVLDFYTRRTQGDMLERLMDLRPGWGHPPDEVAKRDRWANPYMGRWYADQGAQVATELLSMGLELFYKDPRWLADKDPEFFDFIYELVR